MAAPLLVVDAPSMLYRAFFALPKSIKGAEGQPVNALLGTANLVVREVGEHDPRAVVLCFGAEAAHYRVELYSGYHADRPEMPELLVPQWEASGGFFESFGWRVEQHETLEADDLLGSLAVAETAAGGRTLLMTGDRDMFQCVDEHVTVLYPTKGVRGMEPVGPAEVRERYGIDPAQVPDFIALRGDPSDGIPGAKGIGEKTAADLLRRYGNLDRVLENALEQSTPRIRGALRDGRDEILAYREMATLQDAGVSRPPDAPTDWTAGADAAERFGMNALADRLREMA
ncbi:MAG TPA: 5'-3' exonuclease [Solirubrobacterales bacterium]|jgi:DNA polymerase-1|nr:5'-3' exonuclease [Solirubrobacterales bacterium]